MAPQAEDFRESEYAPVRAASASVAATDLHCFSRQRIEPR